MMRLRLAAAIAVALQSTLVAANTIPLTCYVPGGREVPLGTIFCLPTGTGPRLAVCTQVINVSSWAISDRGCMTMP
jgi:hypothetical protein